MADMADMADMSSTPPTGRRPLNRKTLGRTLIRWNRTSTCGLTFVH